MTVKFWFHALLKGLQNDSLPRNMTTIKEDDINIHPLNNSLTCKRYFLKTDTGKCVFLDEYFSPIQGLLSQYDEIKPLRKYNNLFIVKSGSMECVVNENGHMESFDSLEVSCISDRTIKCVQGITERLMEVQVKFVRNGETFYTLKELHTHGGKRATRERTTQSLKPKLVCT